MGRRNLEWSAERTRRPNVEWSPPHRRVRTPLLAGAVVLGVLLSVSGLLVGAARSGEGRLAGPAVGVAGPAVGVAGPAVVVAGPRHTLGVAYSFPAVAGAAVPVRLVASRLGIDTALQPLGLLGDGTLEPPSRWQEAGWYAGGVRPGDPGPAVIAGHVDSYLGPAVFSRLHELRPGDVVSVIDQAGRRRIFVVQGSSVYPKDAFPTEAVYGASPLPLLRLVTCTGEFDWQTRNYLDNLVVTARLA